MNIKWATLTVGAIFGFAHIGILGHLINRPQYPTINFPDGDYSSFKVQSGKMVTVLNTRQTIPLF